MWLDISRVQLVFLTDMTMSPQVSNLETVSGFAGDGMRMILFVNLFPVLVHFIAPWVEVSHFRMNLAETAEASLEERKVSPSSWKVGTFSNLKLLIKLCLANV